MRANYTRISAVLIDGDFLFALPIAFHTSTLFPIGETFIILLMYVNFLSKRNLQFYVKTNNKFETLRTNSKFKIFNNTQNFTKA